MSSSTDLLPGKDYTINADGKVVLTAAYLLKRGYCCGSGCLHCPYPQQTSEENILKDKLSED